MFPQKAVDQQKFLVACKTEFFGGVANVVLPTLLWTLIIDNNGVIAGILQQIQCDLKIGDMAASFIQITYFVSYVSFGLFLVGLQNHRNLKRCIMATTVVIWIISVSISYYEVSFWSILGTSFFAGLGEATYSTIALTNIGLQFGKSPSKYLFLFFITVPFSNGLSLTVSSKVVTYTGSCWQSGYHITAICWAILKTLLLLCVKIIQKIGFVQNPPLDERETEGDSNIRFLWNNFKQITKKKSFLMMTVLHFIVGSLNYWGPKLIILGLANQKNDQSISSDNVSLVFGMVVMIASVIGVLPHFIRRCPSPSAALVSKFFSAILAIVAVILSGINTTWCLVFFFLCFVFINFTSACVAKQMCLDFQTTPKKSFLFLPLLGEVLSNLLIGLSPNSYHFLLSNVSTFNNLSPDTTNSTMMNDAMLSFTNLISSTNTCGDKLDAPQLALIISLAVAMLIILVFFGIHIFKRASRTLENVELGVAVANYRQSTYSNSFADTFK